ncbi:RAMP superfamily CRISPR-associated protein [Nostoc sp. MG11]|uniref:RAMP superfamily CRISPR-associated protein n=1 Tax=Nostoc sp. MG11 TaxID=2721166 RepID=UPI0018660EC4|nr:RAMP superfamily CRISPR-associated protein [Nostoc sp. MG11]
MPDKNDVPLMYRAQLEKRCQLHRIYGPKDLQEIAQEEELETEEQYSERWVKQWLESQSESKNSRNSLLDDDLAKETTQFQTKQYKISWRFVTNGGKDDRIIRPLIAASGLPYYPGSSMKGAFREACRREEEAGRLSLGTCDRYCGAKLKEGDSQPGILRFHGGYPVNKWQENLLDIVHPQQQWQVQTLDTTNKPKNESAFALISLYKPTIKFGISCQLKEINWDEIWNIWEKALGFGIGCRVSCGYGLADKITGDVLYQVKLHGKGASSKLIDKKFEFRPNIFRAALRGHALRIFGGLNPNQAEDIVDELFGGIRPGKEKIGLLGMAFYQENPDFVNDSDVYDVSGKLIWLLLGKLENFKHRPYLQNFVEKLTQFAMLLGGFGKSWRRADHRIFYPKYTEHIIGCHWNWVDDNNPIKSLDNQSLDDATTLIKEILKAAKEWMVKRGYEVIQSITTQPLNNNSTATSNIPKQPQLNKPIPRPNKKQNQATQVTEWREAWHQENVQVWGIIAKNAVDSKVIHWLHSSKQGGNQQPQKGSYHNPPNKPQNQSKPSAFQRPAKPINPVSTRPNIYRTSLTGRLQDKQKSPDPTQIGRLWHRMYPLKNDQYIELITIFPKGCAEAKSLIEWLAFQAEWKRVG